MSVKARFIDPMLLLKTEGCRQDLISCTSFKLDGYRAVAFKTGGIDRCVSASTG
jgi:hypothetical protein